MKELRVCLFRGVASVPQIVAAEQGFFAGSGLDIAVRPTRSSDELMEGLLDGSFDIVHANPDNFIAWRDRTDAPVVAWVGGAIGPLKLVAMASIESVATLRGHTIAVDAVGSGWVPVLRRLLESGGLESTDYELRPFGTTRYMYEAVVEGAASASMLSVPWWLQARDAGLRLLADHRSVIPRMQGSAGASLTPWLESNSEAAKAYLRAIISATTWMYTLENRMALVATVATGLGMSPDHAESAVVELLDPLAGWPPSAMIDPEGMATLHLLRAETEAPPRSSVAAYYTDRPYRDAMTL